MSKYNVNISLEQFSKANKKNASTNLYDRLEELEKEYYGQEYKPLPDLDLKEDLELDKIDFDKKTEEELKKQASDEVSNKLDKEIENLENTTDLDNKLYENKIESYQNSYDNNVKSVEKSFENAKQNAKNSALKNGLARSSIMSSQIASLDSDKIDKLDYIQKEAAIEVGYIQTKIDSNLKLLEDAKNNYDENLQASIEKHLLELTQKQEEEYNKVIKYNNDVDIKQAAYKIDKSKAENARVKTELERQQAAMSYGGEQKRQEYFKNQMNTAKEYFDSMSPKEALDIINNDKRLKSMMGNYYNVLKKHYENKSQ